MLILIGNEFKYKEQSKSDILLFLTSKSMPINVLVVNLTCCYGHGDVNKSLRLKWKSYENYLIKYL